MAPESKGRKIRMCWSVPAKVVSVSGHMASVDLGGVRRDVLVGVEKISPGELVMIHAGVVIGTMRPEDVIANMTIYRDIAEADLVDSGMDEAAARKKANDEMNKLLLSLEINDTIEAIAERESRKGKDQV